MLLRLEACTRPKRVSRTVVWRKYTTLLINNMSVCGKAVSHEFFPQCKTKTEILSFGHEIRGRFALEPQNEKNS